MVLGKVRIFMKVQYVKFFSITERISNLFFLNLLWIIACLPIFTIFPSTAAMFGVFREWVTKKETRIFRIFFQKFKENFKQSMVLELAWLFYLGIAFANLSILDNFNSVFRTVILSILISIGILLFLMSIYMVTLMVHYNLSIPTLWKNSFLLSLTCLPSTFLVILIICVMAAITYFLPIVLIFVFSVTAYLLFLLCFRAIIGII
ncbi:YesL family protein [Neobacillus sp. NPDC097160]|uniref:YesL family protein n=1 Tax=Neobacillus sp. NPDC097160 TaxID=3364298 RepID=UPI0037FFDDC7